MISKRASVLVTELSGVALNQIPHEEVWLEHDDPDDSSGRGYLSFNEIMPDGVPWVGESNPSGRLKITVQFWPDE